MKYAAVAETNFYENVIKQRIIKVCPFDTWKDAHCKAFAINKKDFEYIQSMPDSLDEARDVFFNGDMDICVTFFEINGNEGVNF